MRGAVSALRSCDKNLLLKQIKSQKLLKSFLGLERSDKIDVNLIHIVDELFNGYSIMVSGDAIYTSPKNTKVKINICVFRHRNDNGAIFLCDERFRTELQRALLSKWLRPYVQVFQHFGACFV